VELRFSVQVVAVVADAIEASEDGLVIDPLTLDVKEGPLAEGPTSCNEPLG
jgi:hypothetical protein